MPELLDIISVCADKKNRADRNLLKEYQGVVTSLGSRISVRLVGGNVDYKFRNPYNLPLSVGNIVVVQSKGINMINGKIIDKN